MPNLASIPLLLYKPQHLDSPFISPCFPFKKLSMSWFVFQAEHLRKQLCHFLICCHNRYYVALRSTIVVRSKYNCNSTTSGEADAHHLSSRYDNVEHSLARVSQTLSYFGKLYLLFVSCQDPSKICQQL